MSRRREEKAKKRTTGKREKYISIGTKDDARNGNPSPEGNVKDREPRGKTLGVSLGRERE